MNYTHVRRKKRPEPKFTYVSSVRDAQTQTYCAFPERGEKLYVTKDKRRPTSWRRCLSWIVACTVISVVLILAILAGTGVILSQEPNLVKEASVGRNFAGSNLKPAVTNKSPTPTAEMYMYVPRSIESEFVIDNLDFDPAFKDVNSTAYRQFAANMEDQLKMLLFEKETLEFGASDVGLKVVNVSRDPFKVNYRIGWNYKQGVNNPPEPIKMEDVKKRLVESLNRNQGYIDKYHIDREAIKVNHVINTCQMDNGGCSHICYYNYNTQQFVCTCPTHLVIDSSGKNCVPWTDSSQDDALPVPSQTAHPGMPHQSTSKPVEEEDFDTLYEHGQHHHPHHDHDYSDHPSGHESKGQDHGEHGEPEPTAEAAPEPNAEPYPHHKEHDYSSYDTNSGATPEPTAEPKSYHDHSGHDHSEHDMPSLYEAKEPLGEAETTAEPSPDDKHHHSHFMHAHKEHEPSAESTPESVPEPTGEQKSEGRSHDYESHSYGFQDHELSAEPTPEPSPEPSSSPTAEHDIESKDRNYSGHSVYESKDHESEAAAEPTPEPSPEPTPRGDSHEKDHNGSGHSFYISRDHEPASEPTPEPSPVPVSTEDSNEKEHDHSDLSIHGSKDHEPAAELTPEPTAAGDSSEEVHHTFHGSKDHEPAAEPTPKLTETGHSNEKHYENSDLSIFASKDHEPTAEPVPEPTTDSDFSGKMYDSSVHTVHGTKDQEEKEVDTTAEPSPDSISDDKVVHSVPESKNQEIEQQPNAEVGFDSKNLYSNESQVEEKKEMGHKPEPTAEPSPDSESTGTTIHHAHDHINSGQFVPVDGETKKAKSGTDHPTGQTEPEREKSMHHVPYLEDVLIKNPSPSSENTTYHSVQLMEKPVVEEIIIDNSGRKSTDEIGLPSTHLRNESEPNSGASDSSTKTSILEIEQDDSGSQGTTLHPGISTEHTSTPQNVSGGEADKSTENPDYDLTTKSKNDPSRTSAYFSMGVDNLKEHDQARKTMNATGANMSVTTPHSEMHHTIPVIVEMASEENTGTKPEKEIIQTDMPTAATRVDPSKISGVLHGNQKPSIMEIYATADQSPREDEMKPHETATESQVSMTTLLTILTPKGIQKVGDHLIKEKDPSKMEIENKTVNIRQSQQEGSQTTKSPEEISNNIKDELSENEEFNTLIDEEFKLSTDVEKETTNKYSNKPLKAEKKKVKDYTKGEKTDQDKSLPEVTARPGVTPEDVFLQKHVNGNVYDLDFSLQNEHTTKHDGEVTVTDPHGIDVVPGVSFKPHGINNHDLSVLQTVAPDFRTETIFPGTQEMETLKPDSILKNKFPEIKDGEFKTDKDYTKFDKDYKYEKQKVSKKKDLKKKIGGKDGKNVELENGRKVSKEDFDVSIEEFKEIPEATMNPSFEKITIPTEVPEYTVKSDAAESTTHAVEMRTEPAVGVTELPAFKSTAEDRLKLSEQSTSGSFTSVDQKGHLTIDEPTVKSTSSVSPGTVYDGQLPGFMNRSTVGTTQTNVNSTGTVFEGIPNVENTTFVIYQTTDSKIVSDGKSDSTIVNSTTAHPTIIIHGQSGNLQDGHTMRFSNSSFLNPNTTVVSIFNGTLTHPDGHSFSFTNYTATFPNGSAVHPTIIVRGQSGTLQDGHQLRFGNSTFVTHGFKNSNVYRIENETLPGTVFDGHFNPQNGHYNMFTNSSGTFVYTNASAQPAFIIKGESGDFGNSTAYVFRNSTKNTFSGGFVGPQSVIFRNSTVFAVETDTHVAGGVQEVKMQPQEVTNETILFTNQMSPSFVSSGTAYKVNDYFGYISKCAAGQFQCVNGTSKRGSACINLSSKCDSVPDCSDGSDELGCIEKGCPGNFQCSDGTCLKRNLVCNGIVDCKDESDEKNCESWKCEFDEFQCPSGRCIPVVWQCDGKPDCDNHTDEYNCQTSCGNDEYLCPEGWCIPLTYKCNGVKECSNGEDEQLCDCSHEEFKCHTGGCVSMNNVCDGLEDCPDRSDEWDCVKLEPESNLLKIRSAAGDYAPVCADGWASQYSDEVCASLGYLSSIPIENENGSSIMTDSSFFVLKNDTTLDFNKKIIVNLKKGDGKCSSGKMVEISCQEFSCGSRSMTDSSSIEARLVGGMSAASGQWPSVALLYNVRNFHSCTANVLTPRWVLASYNCLKMGNKNLNEQDWKFFGGSTVFETEKENAETRKILRIIPHPQLKFNQFLFTNDLALVELDQSLQFTSNLGAVCLPGQEIQPRQICVTAGWGMNSPEDKSIKQQLQYLPVPTMNLTECNSTEHYSGFITEDKICAGYNSVQTSLCYNEEGAPLMCVNDMGEWELQGVLSYHSNCGRGSHPSIFSSITPVTDWIKKTIGNNFERKALPVTKR